jgi:hypothetical protein
MTERKYLLKIKLNDIEPEIWRRFVVPGSISLDRLHDAIQIVMGWNDRHLFKFKIYESKYTERPETKDEGLEAGKYRLGNLIKGKGRSFQYIYDFGDYWEHEIILEDDRYAPSEKDIFEQYIEAPPIECLEGARACPPEDVGSAPGYYNFCEAFKNPRHKEHRSLKRWVRGVHPDGENYDIEKFDINSVNNELRKYMRWSRARDLIF